MGEFAVHPRRRRGRACVAGLALFIGFAFASAPDAARAADGAYQVDDAEVGAVGACKVESWASFASNSDIVGAISPACVVNLGRPVELNGTFSPFRSAGEGGASFTFKAKTNLIPIEPGKIGVALAAGTSVDVVNRLVNGVFVTVPISLQVHEQVRINVNGGWLWDPSTRLHYATWGAGFEWNFVKPLTLIGEVFGVAGNGQNNNPRAQLGIRYTPQENFDIDLIYGRNITGENAHWVTIGLNVRFDPPGKGNGKEK